MPLSRYRRDPDAGVLAGVCAGIARTLGVDPTLVRLIFALLALAGGAGILLYLATSDILPEAHANHPTRLTLACTIAGAGFMWLVIGLAS